MKKIQKFHHSVTENGKLQSRIITEYQDDEGNVVDKKYSDPYTPVKIPTVLDSGTKDEKEVLEDVEDGKEVPEDVEDVAGFNMYGWDARSKFIVTAISEVTPDYQEPIGIGVEETVNYDRVVEEDGKIAIRRITRIFDEGEEVSKKFHRSWVMPGDDTEKSDPISKAIAVKLHAKNNLELKSK